MKRLRIGADLISGYFWRVWKNRKADMEITKIYFDMDGVLADFDRGIVELCHLVPRDQYEPFDADKDAAMWAAMREVDHYYDKLELMPGLKKCLMRYTVCMVINVRS